MLELPRYGLDFDTILLLPHILPLILRVHSPDDEVKEFKGITKRFERLSVANQHQSQHQSLPRLSASSVPEVNNIIKCKPVEMDLQ